MVLMTASIAAGSFVLTSPAIVLTTASLRSFALSEYCGRYVAGRAGGVT